MTHLTYQSKLSKRLGAAVFRLRNVKGWTRTKLAQRAGISVTYVRQIEQGDNVPTLTIIVELAEVLGVTPAELVREATEDAVPSP
jgi:transcriptional regulator with XRE-family HTH domain